jgi:hypothetical protein
MSQPLEVPDLNSKRVPQEGGLLVELLKKRFALAKDSNISKSNPLKRD